MLVPLAALVLNFMAWAFRRWQLYPHYGLYLEQRHTQYFVLLTYLMLPPVSFKMFQALDCVKIAGGSFLRVDTAISCNGTAFEAFRLLDVVLIAVYLSFPVIWLVLLIREERMSSRQLDMDEWRAQSPLLCLFGPYEQRYYWFEVAEMFRRLLFICVLPLVSTKPRYAATVPGA